LLPKRDGISDSANDCDDDLVIAEHQHVKHKKMEQWMKKKRAIHDVVGVRIENYNTI